jgi:hypothetical protein
MNDPKVVGFNSLSVALVIFDLTYRKLIELMPAFISRCEPAQDLCGTPELGA